MRARRFVPVLAVALSVSACSEAIAPDPTSFIDVPTGPAFATLASFATTGTVVYDFTTLPRDPDVHCLAQNPFTAGGALADGFEGLTFLTAPDFGYCPTGERWGLFPLQDTDELLIQLPAAATSASLEYYGSARNPWLQLTAYQDALPVGQTVTPGQGFDVASVEAPSFNRIGIASSADEGYFYFTLTVTYAGYGNPVRKDDCRSGGWQGFGFANQGQCVRFVETGKDSR